MDFNELLKTIGNFREKQLEANEFIIEIAKLLNMNTDGMGFDELQFTIEDFEEAIDKLKK